MKMMNIEMYLCISITEMFMDVFKAVEDAIHVFFISIVACLLAGVAC